MGVNMAGFSIVDDEVCREASRQEVIRRYFQAACRVRQGQNAQSEVDKIELLMRTLDIEPERLLALPRAGRFSFIGRIRRRTFSFELI